MFQIRSLQFRIPHMPLSLFTADKNSVLREIINGTHIVTLHRILKLYY
jgi:hypothetical protein